FIQRVVKQSGVTHTQIGRTTVGLAKYVKKMSFDEQLRTGQGWFAHSPLAQFASLPYRPKVSVSVFICDEGSVGCHAFDDDV
ncbi:hypothetical protein, partial [Bacillus sp. JCM 19034]|uniref:hypothetical protein n=1 Tax=Bacillus sp. JCM 19034 TaxID=1481928 RepID=UPI000B04971B